jgi:hypothetical protein
MDYHDPERPGVVEHLGDLESTHRVLSGNLDLRPSLEVIGTSNLGEADLGSPIQHAAGSRRRRRGHFVEVIVCHALILPHTEANDLI